jgi:hypothetical protein
MIACITMLIDHLTYFFVPEDSGFLFQITIGGRPKDFLWVLGRAIGRIAFPIFAFLIVEGFYHTKNIKKYVLRLSIFAVIAELPYYWAFWFPADITNENVRRNIMFTLLLGLLVVILLDNIYKAYYFTNPFFMNIFMTVVIVAGGLSLIFMRGSYQEWGYGVILMVGFYLAHRSKKWNLILFILIVGFLRPDLEFMAILAAPILYFYNGEKGRNVKYFFYIFYPAHLVILCLIRSSIAT